MTADARKQFGEKLVKVYKGAGENLPVIYSNDFEEAGEFVIARCAKTGCKPFHLVSISGFDWDSSLSPWESEPVVSKEDNFQGKAPEHLKWILDEAVPYAEGVIGERHPASYISGYSMGGLFALWALYQTSFFEGAMSASGSVWFSGFEEYALKTKLAGDPKAIYMSLGNKETHVKNKALQHTDEIFKTLCAHYQELGIPAIFETNPGNHFQDYDIRVARGLKWMLNISEA